MSSCDPRGYYRILGVATNSSASEIKSAYRRLVKELHPDINHGHEATSKFQQVQEAYGVLGDANHRAQYDALGSTGSPQPEGDPEKNENFNPIRCTSCNCIIAQPRIRVFYFVVSYFFGSLRKPLQGVFCSKCEIYPAVKATLINILFGWWSITGFFETLGSLYKNLSGGIFHTENAFLQAHQSFYFYQEGKLELAAASAREVFNLLDRSKSEKSYIREIDRISHLRKSVKELIDCLPEEINVNNFRKIDGLKNWRFISQIVIIFSAAALISGFMWMEQRERQAEEADRLRAEGIAQAQAEAIAAEEEAALKAMEQPLPESGVHYSLYGRPKDDWPPFKINNGPVGNALVKLSRASDGEEVISIFVRAGETVEVAVPLGSYEGKIASGQTWYGDEVRFGPETSYAQFGSDFAFTIEGDQLVGTEVTLTYVENGNLSRRSIDAIDF